MLPGTSPEHWQTAILQPLSLPPQLSDSRDKTVKGHFLCFRTALPAFALLSIPIMLSCLRYTPYCRG
ncbi:hypothetical protein BJY04DRAFT_186925 [Aspergillus karnatakaensis]|uniref:uncharacterized protein n=1 Tax=Aspergillus karnatakaensis TaxID=1810916 RepID=UPI003CCDF743